MKLQPVFFCIALCCLSAFVQAQSNMDQLRAKEMLNARLREEEEQRRKAAEAKMQQGNGVKRAADTEANLAQFSSENELPRAEKLLLIPDAAQVEKYRTSQPDAAIFKLLNYQEDKVKVMNVDAQFVYPHIRGGGSYYSFAKRNHNADEWAQLRLQDGILQPAYIELKRETFAYSGGERKQFVFVSGYSLALFSVLGDVNLNEVNEQLPALQSLATWSAPKQYSDFISQLKQSDAGFQIGANRYQSSVPARLDTTYLMRSINYKKADVIIAFRIVQQDRDGNLHILWKQLKSFPSAELKGKPPKP